MTDVPRASCRFGSLATEYHPQVGGKCASLGVMMPGGPAGAAGLRGHDPSLRGRRRGLRADAAHQRAPRRLGHHRRRRAQGRAARAREMVTSWRLPDEHQALLRRRSYAELCDTGRRAGRARRRALLGHLRGPARRVLRRRARHLPVGVRHRRRASAGPRVLGQPVHRAGHRLPRRDGLPARRGRDGRRRAEDGPPRPPASRSPWTRPTATGPRSASTRPGGSARGSSPATSRPTTSWSTR